VDTSRVLLAIILSLGLIFAYQELVLKRMYPPPSAQSAQPKPSGAATANPAAGIITAPGAKSTIGTLPPPGAIAPERLVVVESEVFSQQRTKQISSHRMVKQKRRGSFPGQIRGLLGDLGIDQRNACYFVW